MASFGMSKTAKSLKGSTDKKKKEASTKKATTASRFGPGAGSGWTTPSIKPTPPGDTTTPTGAFTGSPGGYSTGPGGNYVGAQSGPGGSYLPSPSPGGSSLPGSGLPSEGTDPYSGRMGQFNPGVTQETIFRDPQMILADIFAKSGVDTSSPMYSTMRDFYGADPQALWYLMNPSMGAEDFNAERYGNYLYDLYGGYMSPGGRAVDFNEILGNVSGAGEGSGLQDMLTAGGPAEQVRTLYGLLGDAARVGLSPAMASAFMDALAKQSDSYLSQAAQSTGGDIDPYYQWFQDPRRG